MQNFFKIIKKITGYILISAGIIGLFLPFMQGIALIIAGATISENKKIIKLIKILINKTKEKIKIIAKKIKGK